MVSDEIVSDLLNLGLTLNESKAYKTLVNLGQSTARKIAEQSGVPRSKVYETLGLLEKRGITRRIQGTDRSLKLGQYWTLKSYPPRNGTGLTSMIFLAALTSACI